MKNLHYIIVIMIILLVILTMFIIDVSNASERALAYNGIIVAIIATASLFVKQTN